MSLRPLELEQVAAELREHLAGAVVQKVHAPGGARAWLELRLPGRSVLLHLCAERGVGRVSIVEAKPKGSPGTPTGFQQLARNRLAGAPLTTARAEGTTLTLDWTQCALVVELGVPSGLLLVAGGRVLAASGEGLPPEERPGALYQPRPTRAARAGSRLEAVAPSADFARARAAEQLFTSLEAASSLDAARAPLVTALARLGRTRKKVAAEAARGELAARHRRDGELLKRHLADVPRGAKELTLTEYLDDGSVAPRRIVLDPARSAAQHAEWLFHQYRRLSRGVLIATERLAVLDREQAALEAKLAHVEPAPAAGPAPRRKAQPTARPFREYQGHGGGKIWVGRGGAENDTLSFKLARPHHLWLHARGVAGAHVVIPLAKGASVAQELLLDAAHLALHHSNLKGEPRGEVSYLAVKHLRKVKGAPGAVTYSQERTFQLRVEPERLARLLRSES